ncbi:MAG: TolC family protein [Acidobacteria bacterium]|nr:TolC family protein [Acidobacteriota bacterium]
MRNRTGWIVCVTGTLAAMVLAGAAPSSAQTSTPPQGSTPVRLSVVEAIDLALKASHRISEFEAREDAAKASTDLRDSADRPIVSLLGGYTRTNHVDEFAIQIPGMPPRVIYPDLPDNWRSRLDVQWPVYTSGRLEALDRAAQAEQNAAGKDVATVRADIRLDAARAFWSLVTATESVTVVEDALKLVEAHLQDVRNMLAVGLVAPNDVLTAEANRSRQQVLLIEARNIRDVAEADLRRATGLGRAVRIDLAAALDGPRPDAPTFDELLAEARKNRSERQALQLRVDGVGQQRAAAAAGSKPVVSVGGGVDYARPNPRIFPRAGAWNESWDVGVNVAWQLWDGGRVKADVAQASASERAAQQRLAEFDTVLEFDVRQRQLDLTSAVAAIAAATAEVASAAEARRVVAERFKAGLASSTDVLDAQQALVGAQLGRTRTLATIKLAQARLDRVLGR